MRDSCREVWATKSALQAKRGSHWDFDDLREQAGEMPREKVAEMAAYAFWDRVRRHRASPVTDPFRQFNYPRIRGRTQFSQLPDNSAWKGKP